MAVQTEYILSSLSQIVSVSGGFLDRKDRILRVSAGKSGFEWSWACFGGFEWFEKV